MRDSGGQVAFILMMAIMVAGMIGWVMNIIALFHSTDFSGLVLMRAVGIVFAPLGAVLGWI